MGMSVTSKDLFNHIIFRLIPFAPAIYDLLIIDEASQCDIASILPLLYRVKRVVIIGDNKQLPHISSISKKQDIPMFKILNKYLNGKNIYIPNFLMLEL